MSKNISRKDHSRRFLPISLSEGHKLSEFQLISENDLIKFIGTTVLIKDTPAPFEDVFVEGELSYHHPYFQIVKDDGNRVNIPSSYWLHK